MKKLKLFGLLGLMLFIGSVAYTTNVSAMERHAVFLERNIPDKKGQMHHHTKKGYLFAQEEFRNTIDPYSTSAVLDAFKSKAEVINSLNTTFANSKDEDINYLIIESHGYSGGIIDFSFQELKNILDSYKGKFVLVIHSCHSGSAINKIQMKEENNQFTKNLLKTFGGTTNGSSLGRCKIFEKNYKYTVFCSCTDAQYSYHDPNYSYLIKGYFDGVKQKNNLFASDYNKDEVVTADEMFKYLSKHGKPGAISSILGLKSTPVASIPDPNLPVFAKSRTMFDFYGIGNSSGYDTHIAQLRYNKDHTATIQTYSCNPHPYFKDTYISIKVSDAAGHSIFTKEIKGTDWLQTQKENFNLSEGSNLTIYHAEGTSGRFTTSNNQTLKQHPATTYHYVVHDNKLLQMDGLAQRNSIRLNQVGTGSYVYVENGYLCANNANVKSSIVVTKNGQEVTLDNNNHFTELKAGDTFTIQPISSTWKDEPVTSRKALGTFDGANKYMFKVNNDGAVSLVATEKASARDNIHRIFSALDQTKCLDNNPAFTDLFVWSKQQEADNHYFAFHFVSNDIVKISSKDKSRWLTTNGKNCSTITQIANEQVASYWKIKNIDNNKVVLHYMGNRETELSDSNLSLNICGGKANEGAKLILYSSYYDYAANQQFILD